MTHFDFDCCRASIVWVLLKIGRISASKYVVGLKLLPLKSHSDLMQVTKPRKQFDPISDLTHCYGDATIYPTGCLLIDKALQIFWSLAKLQKQFRCPKTFKNERLNLLNGLYTHQTFSHYSTNIPIVSRNCRLFHVMPKSFHRFCTTVYKNWWRKTSET